MADIAFEESLKLCLEKLSIGVDDTKIPVFSKLYEIMLDENTRQNLTRITEPSEAAEKHIADSLTVAEYIKPKYKVADIGCGAGFPSLPLAIVKSESAFIPVDSTEKRIRYVNETAKKLELSNLSAVAARAEELGKKVAFRESFDIVTGRAVAALNILSEYCLPLVKVGGLFISMKANAEEEIKDAKSAVITLGGRIADIKRFKLPLSSSERTVIVIEKIKNTTEKYPRAGGVISKKPL